MYERNRKQVYLCMEDARRLRRSAFWALASPTRLARVAAYSFYRIIVSDGQAGDAHEETYSSILGLLSIATFQGNAMTLMLKTLGSNETLNLRSLGVWLLTLTLWLDLATDNELANLSQRKNGQHFGRFV